MKVLVFGGSGFLGTALCKTMLSRGYSLTVADVVEPNFDCDFLYCDIQKKEHIDSCISRSFQIVVNLAGYSNMRESRTLPILTMELNVISNMWIVEACIRHSVKRFLFASSAYATSTKGSFYAISKRMSEQIIEEYAKGLEIDYNIIRYGSVYSNIPSHNNFMYNLVTDILENEEYHYIGDGNEKREYIHADDASVLTLDVLENESYRNRIVYFTGSQSITRNELFDVIKETGSVNTNIVCKQSTAVDNYKLTPFSVKIEPVVRFTPNPGRDLSQGIYEIVKAIRENEQC